MDTIQEALQQLHMSRYAIGDDLTREHLDRAQVLATLALAEQVEKLTEKMPDKELSNSRRATITFNDDAKQDVIDALIEYFQVYMEVHGVTAVIVYEEGNG